MNKLTAFLKDESGAAAAEYVLILAIIGSSIASAGAVFAAAMVGALDAAAAVIDP